MTGLIVLAYPLFLAICALLILVLLGRPKDFSLSDAIFSQLSITFIFFPAFILEVVALPLSAICGTISLIKQERLWPLALLEITIFFISYIYLYDQSPLFGKQMH